MNQALPSLLLGVLAGGIAGYFAATIAAPSAAESPQLGAEVSVAQLATEVEALRAELRARPSAPALPTPGGSRQAADVEPSLDALIEAWMAEHLDERMSAALEKRGVSGAAPAVTELRTAEETMLALEQTTDWDEQLALLQAASDAGILDEVLKRLEERAAALPDDERAQLDLANGYLQMIFESGNSPEAGVWAMKVDQTYDKVLALNDHSWEARFGKAVSLSNWPAFLGKQNEAIQHFEVLREQQREVPNRPEFAETYLFLGNMYQQTGRLEEARAAWREGLDRFPDSAQLAGQLNSGGGL